MASYPLNAKFTPMSLPENLRERERRREGKRWEKKKMGKEKEKVSGRGIVCVCVWVVVGVVGYQLGVLHNMLTYTVRPACLALRGPSRPHAPMAP